MNGQVDRCDRTAYVSGLQTSVSDIELFEVFNRVAHVEKVIVRNGAIRHALVVFKTVQGLYQVLVNFQGTTLHGRQIHIRPLRESSHANSETIATMFERAKHQGNCHHHHQQKRASASVQPATHQLGSLTVNLAPQLSSFSTSTTTTNNNNSITISSYRNQQPQNPQQQPHQNPRGYRNSSGSGSGLYGKRRINGGGYNRNVFPNETYSGGNGMMTMFDNHPVQQYSGFNQNDFHFEDYAEGAKRFDNLANVIRASTPTDPFANYQKSSDSNSAHQRSRALSARDHKQPPPTWKMELQIKNETENLKAAGGTPHPQPQLPTTSMTPQQFLAQIAQQAEQITREGMKKKRPNLSVINPSLFYEQYPRTSSPVVLAPNSMHTDKNPSPHDPAVLAYSRLRVPQSAFDGLSPIDTNNCSFITKHLGSTADVSQQKRDLTNEELSDMIVSTGNLRINPTAAASASAITTTHIDSFENQPDEPAPWSPLKRLRAESGSLSTAHLISPQFSPIKAKTMEFNDTEDDVFGSNNGSSENKPLASPFVDSGFSIGGGPVAEIGSSSKIGEKSPMNVLTEQKMSNFEDINNSRLPSNSHSAAPGSEQKSFVFPEYPMCRHSSVPSIAHLVGDLSDFGSLSPHVTASGKFLNVDDSSPRLHHETSSEVFSNNNLTSDDEKKGNLEENSEEEECHQQPQHQEQKTTTTENQNLAVEI